MHEQDPPFGYHGGYLRICLNDRSDGPSVGFRRVELSESLLRQYLGGVGLGVAILLAEGQPEVDPLSPQAGIGFIFSPLVGSAVTTSAKFAVVCKSPLTNRFNDALASSAFAIAGKQTGSDALYITGRAAAPSILMIDDDEVSLVSADGIWGLSTSQTEQRLREHFPSGFQFAVIGPAGENQVRYATISHAGRHAGRGGSGAVLGAKNIKAVAVRGTRRCNWFDPAGLVQLSKDISVRSFGPATSKYRELGTASNLLAFNRLNALPTRNFRSGSFEAAEAISPESLSTARKRTRSTCAACTIGCEHMYEVASGDGRSASVRLEYENLFSLGALCGIGEPDAVLNASRLCDDYGLDTISTGATIAFAMEAAERGFLEDASLRFGSAEALLRTIRQIAHREDLGDLLAEGSKRAAEQLGPATHAFAPHVKGLEIPGYEPRSLQTMALGFAVAARGADHNRSGAYEVDFSQDSDRRAISIRDIEKAIETEDKSALIDSLILCKFLRGIFADLFEESAEILRLITGWPVQGPELQTVAKQIVESKHEFNRRAGWTIEEDTLPDRFFETPLPDDPRNRLDRTDFAAAVLRYHQLRGREAETADLPGHSPVADRSG